METNTLIATHRQGDLGPDIEELKEWLLKSGIGKIQLIHLPSFRRVLVVTESKQAASRLMSTGNELDDIKLSYTLADTESPPTDFNQAVGNLKVPPHNRTFLISPPTSPPPEFDYSRCEEPPNKGPHRDMAPTSSVESVSPEGTNADDNSEKTLLSSKVGTITINPAQSLQGKSTEPIPHTALPPKSIFDEE